jgi:guanylate kinase
METPLALITGFSGAGKNTLYENLMALHGDQLYRAISTTTRSPRPGEIDGRDYFFTSKDDFLVKQAAGHFIESSEHYGNFYGSTSPEHLVVPDGKVPLYILDPKGVGFYISRYPSAKPFFLHISRDEQHSRLTKRDQELHLIEERLRRYDLEHQILTKHQEKFHILPNETIDDLNNAVEYVRRVLSLG